MPSSYLPAASGSQEETASNLFTGTAGASLHAIGQSNQLNHHISSNDHHLATTATGALHLNTSGNIANSTMNGQMILKHELFQTKKQLADAQNSYQFLKREKLRVEHEKNLIEIQFKQVGEADQKRNLDYEANLKLINDLQGKYDQEKTTVQKLKQILKQQEQAYKTKLTSFTQQLEEMSKRKSKAKERLYETGL